MMSPIEAEQVYAGRCAQRPEVLAVMKPVIIAVRLLCSHLLAHEEHRNAGREQSEGTDDPAARLRPIALAVEPAVDRGLDGAGGMNSVIPDLVEGVAGMVVRLVIDDAARRRLQRLRQSGHRERLIAA